MQPIEIVAIAEGVALVVMSLWMVVRGRRHAVLKKTLSRVASERDEALWRLDEPKARTATSLKWRGADADTSED